MSPLYFEIICYDFLFEKLFLQLIENVFKRLPPGEMMKEHKYFPQNEYENDLFIQFQMWNSIALEVKI